MSRAYRVVALISGGGTNLQAILDDLADTTDITVAGVISDKQAAGLERADKAGVCALALPPQTNESRVEYDQRLASAVAKLEPDLVVLAGFMRILSADFVNAFAPRLVNIHPSLLPAHKGLNTHKRVLAASESQHGTTIHVVTAKLDDGPLIMQARLDVHASDTENTLSARIQALEHTMYPKVVRWFAEGRLRCSETQVWLDDKLLTEPVTMQEHAS